MATLRALYDSLDIDEEPIAEDAGGGGFDFADLLTAGKGATFGALDVLDRLGRAVRHLLRGDLGQAAEAFDPFNLFTEEESRPVSGREMLFGDMPNEEGLDATDVIGFGAEIALDPLTYVGGALGRFAAKILGPVGGASTGFLEGLGGTLGSLKEGGRAFRLGRKAAAVSPLASTAVGAAGGGLLGALDPEATAGEGALLGAAAGFGLRAAGPALAKGGLAGLESVSRTFAERNAKSLTAFRRGLDAAHRGDGLKKINAVNRVRGMEQALAEEGRERLAKLVEDPFFAEIYGVERAAEGVEAFKGATAGSTRLMGLGDETVESLGATTAAREAVRVPEPLERLLPTREPFGLAEDVANPAELVAVLSKKVDIASSKPLPTTLGEREVVELVPAELAEGLPVARLANQNPKVFRGHSEPIVATTQQLRRLVEEGHGSVQQFQHAIDRRIKGLEDDIVGARFGRDADPDYADLLRRQVEDLRATRELTSRNLEWYVVGGKLDAVNQSKIAGRIAEILDYDAFEAFGGGLRLTKGKTLDVLQETAPRRVVEPFLGPERPALAEEALLSPERLFETARGMATDSPGLATGAPKLARALKGRSGPEVLASAKSQIARLTPQDKVVLDKFYGGGGKEGLVPGKFWQEQILEKRGILPQDVKDEFVRVSGLAHVPHVRNAQTQDELQHAVFRSIREALGARGKDLTPAQLLVEAKRAKGALRQRGILGSLPQLEEKFPGFFSQDLARIGLEQNRRFIAFTRVDDALDATFQKAQDHGWLATAANADPALIQAGVLRKVDPSVLPFGKHREALKAIGAGEDVYLRREVHDLLFRKGGFVDRAMGRDSVTEFGKFWNKATNLWKGWTLAAFPSWIARNVFGNAWLNHVSGVGPEHLATYGHAMQVQKAIGKLLRDETVTGSLVLKGGQRHDLATLAREAIEDGIMGSGFVQTEVGEAFRAAAAGEKTWDAVKFFDPQHNFITRTGFGINAAGEDWMRLAHYLAKRTDGESGKLRSLVNGEGAVGRLTATDARVNALESTKLHLYDFDELTPFEQDRLRQFFPFYAWFRQNIAGSTRHLVTSPQRTAFVGRLAINLDREQRADVPDATILEWIQGQLHLPISRGKDGTLRIFSLQNWLPLADLAQVETPEKFLQFVVNAAHPVLNEALEQGFNFDTFFKRSIERVAGERTSFLGFNVTKRGEHLVKNLRVLNELDLALESMGLLRSGRHRMDDLMEDITVAEFGARTLGVKIRPINLPLARQRKLASLRREVADLLGKQRRARRDGDTANVTLYARLMAERRQDLQLLASWDPMTHPTYASLASPEVP